MARPRPADVEQAAASIVAAFARTDTDAYFAQFAPQATFVFHSEPEVLPDRASYERLWSDWVESGWRVLECESTNGTVTVFEGGAVFTHDVRTVTQTPQGEEKSRDETRERETIVFAFDGERLLAIHEHLSPAPTRTPNRSAPTGQTASTGAPA